MGIDPHVGDEDTNPLERVHTHRLGDLDRARSFAVEIYGCNRKQVSSLSIRNGLYAINIDIRDGARGRATGVIVLRDCVLLGGDSYFYYTGSYVCQGGKWSGELITHQHTEAIGSNFVFGGRDVSCGFSGSYAGSGAEVFGTALVGKASVGFHAKLTMLVVDEHA